MSSVSHCHMYTYIYIARADDGYDLVKKLYLKEFIETHSHLHMYLPPTLTHYINSFPDSVSCDSDNVTVTM